MKRFFDILLALIALISLSPMFLIIFLLVRIDGAPVIFKQKRVGLKGEEFSIYKFRSMVVNAQMLGPYSTAENDSRITPIGRWIRKTSIDELPQLFNVLKGDMSVVGPRPNVPEQRDQYSVQDWNSRNSILPGITGLAQATKRSECGAEERLSLDLEYVKNQSLFFDVKIILMTVVQILHRGGN